MSFISVHARERAEEHFSLRIDDEFAAHIIARVMRLLNNEDSCERHVRELPGVSNREDAVVVAFRVKDIWLPGVFARDTGAIITILPEEKLPIDLRQGVFEHQE